MINNTEKKLQYLDRLNEQQREAVVNTEGPTLIVAGAGSGKTTVLTTKIAYMLDQGVEPWSILALTFTNKAAREMRERIENIVDRGSANSLWMGTFHSVFSRILRREAGLFGFDSSYTIYQPSDTISLLKAIVKEHNLDVKVYVPSSLADRISKVKTELITPKEYAASAEAIRRDELELIPLFKDIYHDYFCRCHQANAMDFDDLLLYTYLLFRDSVEARQRYSQKFRYILVDEYQDTNYAQFMILKQLTEVHSNICVVGDDAQSIYSFRGARIANILSFEESYKGVNIYRLEQNYRSTQTIVNAANSLISKNEHQIKKTMFTRNEVGSPIIWTQVISDIEEAKQICNTIKLYNKNGVGYGEMAILYRTNAQSRIFEDELHKNNIPCVLYGSTSFYDRKEIRDVLSYFRLVVNPLDEEALRRIINYPTRGIGKTSIDKVFACAQENQTSPWNVVQQPDLYGLGVSPATKNKLVEFCSMVKEFVNDATKLNVYELGQKILKESGLIAQAEREVAEGGREVLDNYDSLLSGMRQFLERKNEEGEDAAAFLSDYLSEVALLTDSDRDVDESNAVKMMTVHIAKGLEFDVVYIAGMDDGIFPSRTEVLRIPKATSKELEEERRLFFVALTRAKKICHLYSAKTRFRYGKTEAYEPSRFLDDIDRQYIKKEDVQSRFKSKFSDYVDFETSGVPEHQYRSRYTQRGYRPSPSSNGEPSFARRASLRKLPAPAPSPTTISAETRSAMGFNVGDTVEHSMFGVGKILNIENGSVGPKALIEFQHCGEKNLLLKFAKLKIVSKYLFGDSPKS